MKPVLLMIAMLGLTTGATAQTNRTYYSNMQTEQMYENERRGGEVSNNKARLSLGTETINEENNTSSSLQMNTAQPYQGYRQNTDMLQQNNRVWNEISRDDLPYRSIPYDTSKNNGHCIGCGSGTMTDPHSWR